MTRLACVLLALLLAGCAASAPRELATASDQTADQRRAEIRLQLAVGYYQQRQLEVALDELKQALAADPDYADAYSMRALIYMDMGETRLADENFQRALKLAPGNPDFANNYGWFLCQNGRIEQSLPLFEQAAKTRSYSSPYRAYNNAGLCSLKAGNDKGAERAFLLAFQSAPQDPNASLHLARLYYARGDYQRARFYASRIAGESAPADVLWLAIKIEHKLGDKAAEAALAAQLRRQHPGSPALAAYLRGAFDE